MSHQPISTIAPVGSYAGFRWEHPGANLVAPSSSQPAVGYTYASLPKFYNHGDWLQQQPTNKHGHKHLLKWSRSLSYVSFLRNDILFLSCIAQIH